MALCAGARRRVLPSGSASRRSLLARARRGFVGMTFPSGFGCGTRGRLESAPAISRRYRDRCDVSRPLPSPESLSQAPRGISPGRDHNPRGPGRPGRSVPRRHQPRRIIRRRFRSSFRAMVLGSVIRYDTPSVTVVMCGLPPPRMATSGPISLTTSPGYPRCHHRPRQLVPGGRQRMTDETEGMNPLFVSVTP